MKNSLQGRAGQGRSVNAVEEAVDVCREKIGQSGWQYGQTWAEDTSMVAVGKSYQTMKEAGSARRPLSWAPAIASEISWCKLTAAALRADAGRLLTVRDHADRHSVSGHRAGFEVECDLLLKGVYELRVSSS